ncbi:MAG: hypothetical protein WKF77_30390 [Planctomycetaceae bacterium]
MKTITVCVSLLAVGIAIFAAHDNPATARENRRNTKRPCCPPVCAASRTTPESPATLSSASPVPVEDAGLRAKLIERRDTLKELVRIQAQREQMGGESTSMLNQAYIDLLEAELPLAKTHAERIVLYEKSLEARTEIEVTGNAEAAVGTQTDYLGKADRIKAEIDSQCPKNEITVRAGAGEIVQCDSCKTKIEQMSRISPLRLQCHRV